MYEALLKEYASDKKSKEKASLLKQQKEAKSKTTKTATPIGLDLLLEENAALKPVESLLTSDPLLTTNEKAKSAKGLLDLDSLTALDDISAPLILEDLLADTKSTVSPVAEFKEISNEPIADILEKIVEKNESRQQQVTSPSDPEPKVSTEIPVEVNDNGGQPVANIISSAKPESIIKSAGDAPAEVQKIDNIEVQNVSDTVTTEVTPKTTVTDVHTPVKEPIAEKQEVIHEPIAVVEQTLVVESIAPPVAEKMVTDSVSDAPVTKADAQSDGAKSEIANPAIETLREIPVTHSHKTPHEQEIVAEPENAKVAKIQEKVTAEKTETTAGEQAQTPSEHKTVSADVRPPIGTESIINQEDTDNLSDEKQSPFNIRVVGKIELPEKKKKKLISYREEKELAQRKADAERKKNEPINVSEITEVVQPEVPELKDAPINQPVSEKPVKKAEKVENAPEHKPRSKDKSVKSDIPAEKLNKERQKNEETVPQPAGKVESPATPTIESPTVIEEVVKQEEDESRVIRAKDHTPKLTGPKVVGKIELPDPKAAKQKADQAKRKSDDNRNRNATQDGNASGGVSAEELAKRKRKRKRKSVVAEATAQPQGGATTSGNINRSQQGSGGQGNQGQSNQGQRRNNNASGGQNQQQRGGGGGGHHHGNQGSQGGGQGGNRAPQAKANIKDRDVKDKVKSTLFQIGQGASRKRQNIRKEKRHTRANQRHLQEQERLAQSNILEVTEYLTANELANLMNISVNEVIAKCMLLGMIVSINQRINSDVIQLIAEEFGYEVKFMSVEESYAVEDNETEDEALLEPRPPIVTVMGHVDHGKTSLLDHIRKANVIAGEAGGITQHIGAYEVELEDGRKIAFLDTPGHEAFTAMRARGAQVTDIAIIVIAADDQVMPQTREAINHAQAAGVPMVFAINKVDKPGAQPEKIKEQLAQLNLLVEDWGGTYQCQEISAKFGKGVNELLEKVLLEAELLNLKANPNKAARGTVIEAKLDKGRGVVATVLVQQGSLKIGDVILANCYYGRVKAMFDERMRKVKVAGPSTPVQILGLDGVPQAGDKFQVMETDRDARELASKRQQLLREQSIRMHKHITLEEIARRSKLGDFKELNIIVKGDVDGSVEALSDSLIKLSTEEVAVRIIMKGVGQISESDVLLASASNAIIIGFQVRPSPNARKLISQEGVDVRIYSVIYNAINEIKDALEGLLRPTIEEEVVGVAEVREVFRISKVGTIAGCMMIEGKINRNSHIRVVRDGIVQFTGRISSLKRFKDDVREVAEGYECGISVESFNDINIGDLIEAFETKEIKRKLE
jgi:translation initiation factor IF-2